MKLLAFSAHFMTTNRRAIRKPPAIFGLVLACAGLTQVSACNAQETNALGLLTHHRIQACSISFVLPAKWSSRVEKSASHCKIIAERPSHGLDCGPFGGEEDSTTVLKQTYCDDNKRIVFDVQPGSMVKLTALPDIHDATKDRETEPTQMWGDFVFDKGKWMIDASFGMYRGASDKATGGTIVCEQGCKPMIDVNEMRTPAGKLVYGERPFRKYFEEGTYCCEHSTWEALVDLHDGKFAWIEMQWGEKKENVADFLRNLR